MNIREAALAISGSIIAHRRALHRIPEPSFGEHQTADYIRAELSRLRIENHPAAGTGIAAVIRGKESGPVVALRADMDAVEVAEETGAEYCSCNPGYMHACGHDAHMAMMLGAARLIQENRDDLRGEVRFLFQPAEETYEAVGGAKLMVQEGWLKGVDTVMGIHVMSDLEAGKLSIEPGPRMAAVDHFVIAVEGRGGHGGLPHQCSDALVAAASIVQNLQQVVARNTNPNLPAVLTVGRLTAGTAYNIIPGEANLEGTARYFDRAQGDEIEKAVHRVVKGTSEAYGVRAKLEYSRINPPVVNDAVMSAQAADLARTMFGTEVFAPYEKCPGGEDFSEMLAAVPGIYVFLGVRPKENAHPHHHCSFEIDESVLYKGTALLTAYALNYRAGR